MRAHRNASRGRLDALLARIEADPMVHAVRSRAEPLSPTTAEYRTAERERDKPPHRLYNAGPPWLLDDLPAELELLPGQWPIRPLVIAAIAGRPGAENDLRQVLLPDLLKVPPRRHSPLTTLTGEGAEARREEAALKRVREAFRTGVLDYVEADRWACALGLPTGAVWPDWFEPEWWNIHDVAALLGVTFESAQMAATKHRGVFVLLDPPVMSLNQRWWRRVDVEAAVEKLAEAKRATKAATAEAKRARAAAQRNATTHQAA